MPTPLQILNSTSPAGKRKLAQAVAVYSPGRQLPAGLNGQASAVPRLTSTETQAITGASGGGFDAASLLNTFVNSPEAQAQQNKALADAARKKAEDAQPWYKKALGTVLGNDIVKDVLTPLSVLSVPLKAVTLGIEEGAKALSHLPGPLQNLVGQQSNPSSIGTSLFAGLDPEKIANDNRSNISKLAPRSDYGSGSIYQDVGGHGLTGLSHFALDIAHDPLTYVGSAPTRLVTDGEKLAETGRLIAAAHDAGNLDEAARLSRQYDVIAAGRRVPLPHTLKERASLVGELAKEDAGKVAQWKDELQRGIQRGFQNMSPAAKEAFGVGESGLHVRGFEQVIPGTRKLGEGVNKIGGVVRSAVDEQLRQRLTTPTLEKLAEARTPETIEQARRIMRSKSTTPEEFVRAATHVNSMGVGTLAEGAVKSRGEAYFSSALKAEEKMTSAEKAAALDAAERIPGEQNIYNKIIQGIRDIYGAVTGREFNPEYGLDRNTYIPHIFSQQFRRYLRKAANPEAEQFLQALGVKTKNLLESSNFLSEQRVLTKGATVKLGGKVFTIEDDTIGGLNKLFADAFPDFKGKVYQDNFTEIAKAYTYSLAQEAKKVKVFETLADAPGNPLGVRITGEMADTLKAMNEAGAKQPSGQRLLDSMQGGFVAGQEAPKIAPRPTIPGSAADVGNTAEMRALHADPQAAIDAATTWAEKDRLAQLALNTPEALTPVDPNEFFKMTTAKVASKQLPRAIKKDVPDYVTALRTDVLASEDKVRKALGEVRKETMAQILDEKKSAQEMLDGVNKRINAYRTTITNLGHVTTDNAQDVEAVMMSLDKSITELQAKIESKAGKWRNIILRAENKAERETNIALGAQLRKMRQLRQQTEASLSTLPKRIADEIKDRLDKLRAPVKAAQERLTAAENAIPKPYGERTNEYVARAKAVLDADYQTTEDYQQLLDDYRNAIATRKQLSTEPPLTKRGKITAKAQREINAAVAREEEARAAIKNYRRPPVVPSESFRGGTADGPRMTLAEARRREQAAIEKATTLRQRFEEAKAAAATTPVVRREPPRTSGEIIQLEPRLSAAEARVQTATNEATAAAENLQARQASLAPLRQAEAQAKATLADIEGRLRPTPDQQDELVAATQFISDAVAAEPFSALQMDAAEKAIREGTISQAHAKVLELARSAGMSDEDIAALFRGLPPVPSIDPEQLAAARRAAMEAIDARTTAEREAVAAAKNTQSKATLLKQAQADHRDLLSKMDVARAKLSPARPDRSVAELDVGIAEGAVTEARIQREVIEQQAIKAAESKAAAAAVGPARLSPFRQAEKDLADAERLLAEAPEGKREMAARRVARLQRQFNPKGKFYEQARARQTMAEMVAYEERVKTATAAERAALEHEQALMATRQEAIVSNRATGRRIWSDFEGWGPTDERIHTPVRDQPQWAAHLTRDPADVAAIRGPTQRPMPELATAVPEETVLPTRKSAALPLDVATSRMEETSQRLAEAHKELEIAKASGGDVARAQLNANAAQINYNRAESALIKSRAANETPVAAGRRAHQVLPQRTELTAIGNLRGERGAIQTQARKKVEDLAAQEQTFEQAIPGHVATAKAEAAAGVGVRMDAQLGPMNAKAETFRKLYTDVADKPALIERRDKAAKLLKRLENASVAKDRKTTELIRSLQTIRDVARLNPNGTDEALAQTESLLLTQADELKRLRGLKVYEAALEKARTDARNGNLGKVYLAVLHDGWKAMHEGPIQVGDAIMDAKLHNMMLQTYAAVTQPKLFGRVFNGLTDLWKSYATLSPGFHVRNAISGIFMNLADGVGLDNQLRAVKLWRAYERGGEGFQFDVLGTKVGKGARGVSEEWLAKQTPDIKRAFEAAFGSGAGGRFTEPLNIGPKAAWYEKAINARAIRFSQKMGTRVEGPLRLAMALDSVQKGESTIAAMERIARVHFNYGELSRLDETAKRLVPFWTFMSRNLPLQLQEMWTNPRAYKYYDHLRENFQVPDEPFTPDYWKRTEAWNTGAKLGGLPLYIQPDVGFTRIQGDFNDISAALHGDVTKLGSNVNPLITGLLDFIEKRDSYYGRTFGPTDYKQLSGPLGGAETILAKILGQTNSAGQVSENFTNLLQSVVPLVDRTNRLVPSSTGAQSDPLRKTENWLRFFGAPIRTLSPKQQEAEQRRQTFAKRDQLAVMRAMLQEQQRAG